MSNNNLSLLPPTTMQYAKMDIDDELEYDLNRLSIYSDSDPEIQHDFANPRIAQPTDDPRLDIKSLFLLATENNQRGRVSPPQIPPPPPLPLCVSCDKPTEIHFGSFVCLDCDLQHCDSCGRLRPSQYCFQRELDSAITVLCFNCN